MKKYLWLLIFIPVISSIGIAYGAITLDNSNRREYGYCPIDPSVISSRVQLEINGCPVVRIYISNWNQLTSLERNTIDSQLRASGFRDIGEFDVRVK